MKQNYSISLLKNNDKLEDILRDPEKKTLIETTKSGDKYLFIEPIEVAEPKWLDIVPDTVSNGWAKKLDYKTSPRLIIQKTIGDNRFILTFGNCRGFLNTYKLDQRFGLIIGANVKAGSPDSRLKSTTSSNIVSGDITLEQKAEAVEELSQFNVNELESYVKSLRIKGELIEGTKSQTFTASSSIVMNGEYDASTIDGMLKKLLKKYNSKEYLKDESLKHLEQITPITDSEIVEVLNKDMFKKFLTNDSFIMNWPDIIDTDVVGVYKFPRWKKEFDSLDNSLKDDLISKMALIDNDESFEKFMKLNVSLVFNEGEQKVSKGLIRCLSGELEFKAKSYVLNNGNWYEIEKDFGEKQNELYKSQKVWEKTMPNWDIGIDEGDYNAKVAKEKNWYLLDKKIINAGGINSKIEVADLAVDGKTLIHVKKMTSSRPIGHLSNQALVSTEAIRSDHKVITERLNLKKADGEKTIPSLENLKTIVLGIASARDGLDSISGSKDLPYVPFFGIVVLNELKRKIEMYGLELKLAKIDIK